MSAIFSAMLLGGIFLAALTGRMPELSQALLNEAGRAVDLTLTLTGTFCFWGGILRIAQRSGLTELIARAASPITGRLFRGVPSNSPAMGAITMNLAANLLGLGNAATPLGIKAMHELDRFQHANGTATDQMVLFVVMNTASLQLIPTTTALLRAQAGAAAPLDILPAVWISSAVSIAVGITAAKLLSRFWR